ncbi:MAG: LysM peptidoglycan-binding domain-containing protein, partial [Pseudonocardia sp.]|nr:LysM peptidoglycan-binding domain-containing protein [Pseudonocardia sp.]
MIALRLVRGLVALLTLAGLVAGVPAVLWLLGSRFLPDDLPTVDDVVVALSRPDDGSLLLGLLVLVGWIAWLQLTYSILVETAAQIRSLPRPDRFGFRTTRTLAALLIGWVLTMAATPASASTTQPVTVSASFLPTAASAESPPADGPVYVVQPRDTLWDIAARVLGDPLRWREILHLNDGRVQADGGRLSDGSVLHVGWELRLPADPDPSDRRVRVEAGDTLTGLADQYLGDPARYPDLYEVNVGVRQPDGRFLGDPDLIRPGWLLTVPTIVEPDDDTAPPPDGTSPGPSTPTPTPAPTREPTTPTRAPTTSVPLPETSAPNRPTGDTGRAQPSFTVPAAIVISGIAASGIVTGIVAYRRRQTRWRRTGRQIALPDLDHSRLESATVAAAQTAGTRFLDTVLRSLTVIPGDGLPSLDAVWLAPAGIDLVLTEPAQTAPPFVADNDGTVWHVDAQAPLPITEQEAVGVANPFPALVSIGTGADGATLMVDVERVGALHLLGDPTRTVDLLRNMAVELGTCRWADDTSVMVVGLEGALTDLPPGRVEQVHDVRVAAGRLRAAISATRRHLDRSDGGSVVDMRVQDRLSDSWVVTVLLVAEPDDAELQVLAELCGDLTTGERTSAAIVIAAAPATLPGEQVHIDAEGTVQIPRLDTGTLHAEQMPADTALGLLSVLGTTLEPDVPVSPAPESQPWANDMRRDGSLQPDTSSAEPVPVEIDVDDPVETPVSPPYVDEQRRDPAAERRLLLVEKQDPELDDDVALWHAETPSPRPLVSILGEPGFDAAGTPPEKRRSWYVEVVVYLALHPAGVDRDKITTDLWPEGSTV